VRGLRVCLLWLLSGLLPCFEFWARVWVGFVNWVEYGLRRRKVGLEMKGKHRKGYALGYGTCSYVYLLLRL
jgi:hypothetical protein